MATDDAITEAQRQAKIQARRQAGYASLEDIVRASAWTLADLTRELAHITEESLASSDPTVLKVATILAAVMGCLDEGTIDTEALDALTVTAGRICEHRTGHHGDNDGLATNPDAIVQEARARARWLREGPGVPVGGACAAEVLDELVTALVALRQERDTLLSATEAAEARALAAEGQEKEPA